MQGRGPKRVGRWRSAARWAIGDDMDGQIGLHFSEAHRFRRRGGGQPESALRGRSDRRRTD